MEYTEGPEGILRASIGEGSCHGRHRKQHQHQPWSSRHFFNITSSGPCLQALTAGADRHAAMALIQAVVVASLPLLSWPFKFD